MTTLDAAIRRLFDAEGTARRARRGEELFRAGTPCGGLLLVESGRVRIVRRRGGRAVTLHEEGPGGVLGEVALFTDGRYPGTAIAAETVTARWVPKRRVLEALAADPALAATLLRRLAARLQQVITRLDEVGQLTLHARLARHLLRRAAATHGEVLNLGLTQAELADELGTVREALVRELRRMTAAGAIAPAGRGRYRVVDAAALRRAAGDD